MEELQSFLTAVDQVLWLGVPHLIKGLVIVLVLLVLFKKQIKNHPWIFYIYPTFILFFYSFYGICALTNPEWLEQHRDAFVMELLWLPHRYSVDTVIGVALIVIVMFIGVLPKSRLVKELFLIRKEMSIAGGAILIGHGMMRLPLIISIWKSETANIFLIIAYSFLGLILLLLILAPWVTSFDFIRKRMRPAVWKKLQTYTSVPLFILMLLFGVVLNLGWSIGAFSAFGTELSEAHDYYGKAIDSLQPGVFLANTSFALKMYVVMLIAYVYLRYKKSRGHKRSSIHKR